MTASRLLKIALALLGCALLFSCAEIKPKAAFDEPIKGKNRKLAGIFGNQVLLKTEADTFRLGIQSTKKSNIIIDMNTGDTLFAGSVILYKGIYYFNQQISDSSYWIYGVKLYGNAVRGLGRGWEQAIRISKHIENGEFPQLVKYIAPNDTYIKLQPDKRFMPALFSAVLSEMPTDTIMSLFQPFTQPIDSFLVLDGQIEPNTYELIDSVYRENNYLLVHGVSPRFMTYTLSTASKNISSGFLNAENNRIPISGLPKGSLYLQINSGSRKEIIPLYKNY